MTTKGEVKSLFFTLNACKDLHLQQEQCEKDASLKKKRITFD